MTTPPPLPPNEPTPPVFSSQPPPLPSNLTPSSGLADSTQAQRAKKSRKLIVFSILLVAAAGLIVVIALAATCPNEAQLRNALYGEMGPEYKRALEWVGFGSKLLHGPHLVYHNHVVYSTLDFDEANGTELRVASGMAGNVQLTPEVKDVKDFILSIPGIEFIFPKKS